jgi:hypothetical protein
VVRAGACDGPGRTERAVRFVMVVISGLDWIDSTLVTADA